MKTEITEWFDSIESGENKFINAWEDPFTFHSKEKEKIGEEIEAGDQIHIYGLDHFYTTVLRTYVLSPEKSLRKISMKIKDKFKENEEERKRYRREMDYYRVFGIIKRAHLFLLKNVSQMRVDLIEQSIPEIRLLSEYDLIKCFGNKIASQLKEQANQKGLCLKGQIPEDLTSIYDLKIPSLSIRTMELLENAGFDGSISSFTTKFQTAEDAISELQKVKGLKMIGEKIVHAIQENGYEFESRKKKIFEYQSNIRK